MCGAWARVVSRCACRYLHERLPLRIETPGPGPTLVNLSSPQATEVRINPVEFNPNFVARMIPKVEWAALVQAADTVRIPPLLSPPGAGSGPLSCQGGSGVCMPGDHVSLLSTVKPGRGTQRTH